LCQDLTITANGSGNVVVSGDSDTGLKISGATTDIITGTNEDLTISANGTGGTIIKSSTNNTTAFQVQNSSGTALFISDTSNSINRPGIASSFTSISLTNSTLDASADVGSYSSIAIGTDGLPVISYYYTTGGDLKVLHCGNRDCSSGNTTTSVDTTNDVGRYTSIAIGTDGLPVISYYYVTGSDLKVTHCGNLACSSGNTTTSLDTSNSVGQYTSIAIGTDGLPVISYYYVTGGDLRIMHCTNLACTSANSGIPDTTNDVGLYTSIAIGTDGLPIISAYDNTNGDLRVTHCSLVACGSGFTTTAVDTSNTVGQMTSIAIGTDGLPVISAYDSTNADLRVTHCGNQACGAGNTTTAVDTTNSVGAYSSIAIGTDGLPMISYQYSTGPFLKVTHCGNQPCTSGNVSTVVDNANDYGRLTSIAIGTDGLPVISSYSNGFGTLRFAHCATKDCASASGTAFNSGIDMGTLAASFRSGYFNTINLGSENAHLQLDELGNFHANGLSTTASTTADAVTIVNSSTTAGADGLQINNSVINVSADALHITPSFTTNATATYNGIELDAFTATQSSGTATVNGLNIGTLTESGTVTSAAINIGTGWDTGISLAQSSASTGLSISAASLRTGKLASLTATLDSSSGGTTNAISEALTISNTSSSITANGLNISLVDNASTLANNDTGLVVSLSGSNTSQKQIGISSTVTRGFAISATSSAGSSILCNGVGSNFSIGICAGSSDTTANEAIGVWAAASGGASVTYSSSSSAGTGLLGTNSSSGAAGEFYAGVFGQSTQSNALAYTSSGVVGFGDAGSGATIYGGYFGLGSTGATSGAALFATNKNVAANILQLQDNGSDVLVVANTGTVSIAPNAAPAADIFSLNNLVNPSTTDLIDGIQLTFSVSNASGDALRIFPNFGGNGNDTYNAIEIGALSMASSSGSNTVNGLNIGNLTESGTVASAAINIGTGWDNSILGAGALSIATSANGTLTLAPNGSGNVSVSGDSDTGLIVTSSYANSLAVGPNGITNPVLQIDSSTSSQAAGLKLTGATSAGTVALVTISSGSNASMSIDAKGTGKLTLQPAATGDIEFFGSSYKITSAGALTVASCTGCGGGLTTVAYSSTPNANGGSISGATLTLTAADGSNPGLLSAADQTIAGTKTFSLAAGKQFIASASAANTLDLAKISNSGVASTTDTKSGLFVEYGTSNAGGNAIRITPSFSTNTTATYNGLKLDAFTATRSGGTATVNGIEVGALTESGTVSSSALKIGTGWDTGVSVAQSADSTGLSVSASSLRTGALANLTATLDSSSGGTTNGLNESITINNTGSEITSNGLNITMTDNASSIINTNVGLNITLNSGSNSSQSQYGVYSYVNRGMALYARSDGVSGNSQPCGGSANNWSVGLCADSLGSAGAGVVGTSYGNSSSFFTAAGAGVSGMNLGSPTGVSFSAGVKGITSISSTGAYTTAGIYGRGSGGPTSTAYGGYFELSASSGTTLGSALYASNSSLASNIVQFQDNSTDVFKIGNGGLVTLNPDAALTGTGTQKHITQSLTNNQTGGTVTGLDQAITISNASGTTTTNGLNIDITDSTSLANINRGANISITDDGSAFKTNTGLLIQLGGTNNGQTQYGVKSTATKGLGVMGYSFGIGSSGIQCGNLNDVISLGVCGASGSSSAGVGVYADSVSSNTLWSLGGQASYGLNYGTGSGTNAYVGIQGETSQTGAAGYTSIGILGRAKGGTGATIYGGYFSLDSSSGATLGSALYASNSSLATNIVQFQDNTTDVFKIANEGVATLKTTTNSATALQQQNSSGLGIFNINNISSSTTGSANMVANPSIESNTNGWALKGAATISYDDLSSDAPKYGSAMLKIVTTAAGGDGASYNVPLVASTQYTFSAWIKASGALTANLERQENGSDLTSGTGNCTSIAVTTSWQQLSCTFTTGGTINSTPNIFIKQTDTSNARNLFIDGVTLVPSGTALNFDAGGANLDVNSMTSGVTINGSMNSEIQPWKLNANALPAARRHATTATGDGYIYYVGGLTTTPAPTRDINYAKLNSDGSIGSWTTLTNALPATPGAVYAQASVVSNGYLYVIGGCTDSSATAACTSRTSAISYAQIKPDGSLGAFFTNPYSLTTSTGYATAAVSNGYLYVLGGYTGSPDSHSNSAKLNADGTTGPWTQSTSGGLTTMNTAVYGASTIVANGNIYVMGGCAAPDTSAGTCTTTPSAVVQYASPTSTGGLSAWSTTTSLPAAEGLSSAVLLNGSIYVIGGRQASSTVANNVTYATVTANGTIGNWVTSNYPLPAVRQGTSSLVNNGYIYTLGGYDGSAVASTAYYSGGARTSVFGSLDLLALTNQTQSDPSGGGSLNVGDAKVVGNLRVDNQTTLNGGLVVNGPVNFVNGTAGYVPFSISNAASSTANQNENLFQVRDTTASGNYNFGGLTLSGGFLARQTYFAEEFNSFKTTCSVTVATTAAYLTGTRGDNSTSCLTGGLGQLTIGGVAGVSATGAVSSGASNAANGYEELTCTSANAARSTTCLETNNSGVGGTLYGSFNSGNMPQVAVKFKANTTPSATNLYYVGISNAAVPVTSGPTNTYPASIKGAYFANCSSPNGTYTGCGNTWYGIVNDGTTNPSSPSTNEVACPSTDSQGDSPGNTNFMYGRIEFRKDTSSTAVEIQYFIDYSVADGINETSCGTVTTTGATMGNTAMGAFMSNMASGSTTTKLDVDYFRVYEDDAPSSSNDQAADSSGDTSPADATDTPPLTADSNTFSDLVGIIDFSAATSEDTTFSNDVYVRGTLYADKIKANQIEGLDVITDQIESLTDKLAQANTTSSSTSVNNSGGTTSGGSNINLANLSAQSATIALDLNVMGSLIANGSLTVHGDASFLGNVSFGGHISTEGDSPAFKISSADGLTGSALASSSVDGNDISGQLSIDLGDTPSNGKLIKIEFKKPYSRMPRVLLTPSNEQASVVQYYVSSTKDGFTITVTGGQLTPSSSLQFNYWVTQ
jgi:hypothetical protein